VKKLISLVFAATLIVGCQGENTQEEKPEAAEKAAATTQSKTETKAEEAKSENHDGHSHEGHDHGAHEQAGKGPKFVEIEPLFECEEPVVIEFFAYHCPHCYNLEPAAEKWREKNKGKVKFLSVPTTLGYNEFGPYLLVHHAAKKLGVLEKAQHAIFERFHKEKKLFASPEDAAAFLASLGADEKEALEVLGDQEYMSKSIEADYELLSKYKVSSVPQVLVNHKYLTNITAAGGNDQVFELVDQLLDKPHSCEAKK